MKNMYWSGTTTIIAARKKLSLFLLICLILAFLMTLYSLFLFSKRAYAVAVNEYPTQANPWGLVLDGNGHIFVAEPGCSVPTCTSVFPAYISEYNQADGSLVNLFTEPVGYSSPAFLALSTNGTLWFSEPSSNAIGALNINNATWNQWVAPTTGASPFDLVLDKNGNLWFSEFGTGSVGFLDTTLATTIVENALPTANSNPYGIALAPDGTIWLTENALNNQGTTGVIASFTPTLSGTLAVGAIVEHTVGVPHPHLLTTDQQGNIWYSGGFTGTIGAYTVANGTYKDYDVSRNACPAGSSSCGVHISGITVDSKGRIWFDDTLSQRVGYLDPIKGTFQVQRLTTNAHPNDGLIIDAQGNIWFSEEYGFKLGELPTDGLLPLPPPNGTLPVSKIWYFAEGRVGKGFKEYITLDNPDPALDCMVTVQYLYTRDNSSTLNSKSVAVSVPHIVRVTQSVNNDLHILATQVPAATVSTIVTVDSVRTPNCPGVVAERPMYFRTSVAGGSAVMGATNLSKSYTFADVQTKAGVSSSISSYFTMLNPPDNQTANVTATYYAGGQVVGSQSMQVPTGARRTFAPNGLGLPPHVVAVLSSDQPIAVERPTYYLTINHGNAGTISSAATTTGATMLQNDWLFAEGYTGGRFQEYLALANVSSTPLTATVKLEYAGGHSQSVNYTIGAFSQVLVDVNALNNHPIGQCDSTPCRPSPEVSVEITSNRNFVAERELFFQYSHSVNGATLTSMGGTDSMGQAGPANYSAYTFAEGYTNKGYNEWLTLQNPTASTETITLTASNGYGRSVSLAINLAAGARSTLDVTKLVVQRLVHNGDGTRAYEAALTVSTTNGNVFVAERPMYWNTVATSFATQGGSDVIGYVGN